VLADINSAYDLKIKTRQLKRGGQNKMGYDWHTFLDAFAEYISDMEIAEVERELEIGAIPFAVDRVDKVDTTAKTPGAF
jgi:hypothetical protein